jgi:hypothetical protein
MIGLDLSPAQRGAPGAPDPMARFFARGTGRHVAIAPAPQGAFSVWSETGPDSAACLRLDGAQATQRLSWRETLTCALRKVYTVADFQLSAGWSQMQSSGSGLSGSYTGNRAVSSSAPQASITVTVNRAKPYDLWVVYTGRVAGAYVRVTIDGAETLVNAIDDPAELGFKAFSTHSATDMQRRRNIKVASGLTGAHQVTLAHGGAANPGGTNMMIEALALSADLTDSRILPPLWQAQTPYVMGDEVQWQGTFYAARANGISGSTPPVHLSGIAGDGGLDWRADNRPTYPQFQAVDYPSEREYALRLNIAGSAAEVGGQTHGNDLLQSRVITLDDAPLPPMPATGTGLRVGESLGIVEQTQWRHPVAGNLGPCHLTRRITAGEMRHDVTMQMTGPDAQIDWFYAGMLPFVHWDGEIAALAFDQVSADGITLALAPYAGQVPPNIALPSDGRIGLEGLGPLGALRYGLAVQKPGAGNRIAALSAFLRPNIDGRQAAGSLDWIAKAYVAAHLSGDQTLRAGDHLAFSSRHLLAVTSA